MKIEVNVGKKVLGILAGIVIILAVVGVYAYGTTTPSNFGHTVGEVNWNDKIAANLIRFQTGNFDILLTGSDTTKFSITQTNSLATLRKVDNGITSGAVTIDNAGKLTADGGVYSIGRVGVGVQSPEQALHVAGRTRIEGVAGAPGSIDMFVVSTANVNGQKSCAQACVAADGQASCLYAYGSNGVQTCSTLPGIGFYVQRCLCAAFND